MTPLRREPAFLRFLAARTVAVAGAAVTAVALPLLVLRLSGSPFLTAAVSAVAVAPYLLFGLVAGALADRVDRRRLMLVCQACSGVALASLPVASALDVLTVGHLLAAAAVVSTAFVWFDAASFGALPVLVGRDRLPEANSLLFTSGSVVEVSFPAVAGLLIAAVGPAYALGVDALSYLLAGLLLATIPVPLSAPRTSTGVPARGVVARTAHDVREGLSFLWGQPVVRALSLLGFGQSLTAGAVTALLVVYAVEGLGIDAASGSVGSVYVAVAVGGLLAGVLLAPLSRRLPVGWISIGAYTANAVLLVALALTRSVVAGHLLLAAWSTASVLSIVNGITTRQRVTPDELQGRVSTTARMIAWGGAPVGALVGGALATATDVRTTYLLAALGVSTSAVLSWASPLRRRDLLAASATAGR